MNSKNKPVELSRLLNEFLLKWWIFVLFFAFFTGAAYVVTENLITPIYRASSTLFVGRDPDATSELSIVDVNLGHRLTSEISNLLTTEFILQEVFLRLPAEHRGTSIMPNLNVRVVPDTRFMFITFDAPNPETSMLVVNFISEILIEKAHEIIGVSNLMVIDYAHLPAEPISPNLLNNIAIAGLIGLLFAAMFIAAELTYSGTVQSQESLESELNLPVLGFIPKHKKHSEKAINKNLITMSENDSFLAESYRMFRANLDYMNVNKDIKVIVFSSASPNEGKTTSIANTARSMASLKKKVLLIDCDLRNGSVHKMFNLSKEPGLVDVISGNIHFEKAINRSAINMENLDIITVGKSSALTNELLFTPAFEAFINQAREIYDYIFIDTPPLLFVSDATLLSKLSDGVVLVSAISETQMSDVIQSKKLLNQSGARILGLLLLKVKTHYRQNHYAYHRMG